MSKGDMQPPPYPSEPANYNAPPAQQGFINPAYSPSGSQPFPTNSAQTYPSLGAQPYPPAGAQPYPPNNTNVDDNLTMSNGVGSDKIVAEMAGFEDKAVRRGFIRKVYGILICQLNVTGTIIALFLFIPNIQTYILDNLWVLWTSIGLMFACLIALVCFSSLRRTAPWNFVFLGVFTLCIGFMTGVISSFYDVDAVLIAVGITCAVTFALTIFAVQTKIDFTTMGGVLCSVLVIFIFAGICMSFMPQTKWSMIGYGSAGALIFSLYIVYDTQIMMGGNHKFALSPEEYVFASLNLYLDIINLFLYILKIVGAIRK